MKSAALLIIALSLIGFASKPIAQDPDGYSACARDPLCDPAEPGRYPSPHYLETVYLNVTKPSSRQLIDGDAGKQLLKTIQFMKKEPYSKFQIEGHVMSSGDIDKDIELGQKIADAARHFLLSKGIPATRFVETISYGGEKSENFRWPPNKTARIEQYLVEY